MSLYFDHAATSFPKPPEVVAAVTAQLTAGGGSAGRGVHGAALDADRMLLAARETLAALVGLRRPSQVVFSASATAALNQALFGLLRPGHRVVTSTMEHNALIRPLQALADRGIEVVQVAAGADGFWRAEEVIAAAEGAQLVALAHGSNVNGAVQDLAPVGAWCRRHGVPLLVDAAQTAGHWPLSMEALGIDLLAVPGHKGLLGPQGVGALLIRDEVALEPLIYGGTGSLSSSPEPPPTLPERLEPGTHNLPGIAGLAAGVQVVQRRGVDAIQRHLRLCVEQLTTELAPLPGVRLVAAPPERNCGVVSLCCDLRDPAELAFRLDREYGITVRAGLHCAPAAHRTLGTFPRGTLRISPGGETTPADLERLVAVLRQLIQ